MTEQQTFAFRPYVSGDLEFLGFNKQLAPIVEMAFVLDTGAHGNLRDLPMFHCFIDHDHFDYSEPWATNINKRYFEEYVKMKKGESQYNWMKPKEAFKTLATFLKKASEFAVENFDKPQGLEDNIRGAIQIAGKNYGSTDSIVMEHNCKKYAPELWSGLDKAIHYRFIDVGSEFYPYFGYIPMLDQINQAMGRKTVNHHAYDDAVDVIFAHRWHWAKMNQVPFEGTTYDGQQ